MTPRAPGSRVHVWVTVWSFLAEQTEGDSWPRREKPCNCGVHEKSAETEKCLMAKLHSAECVCCYQTGISSSIKRPDSALRGRNVSVLKHELRAAAGRPTETRITDHRSLWMVIGYCWLRLLSPQWPLILALLWWKSLCGTINALTRPPEHLS